MSLDPTYLGNVTSGTASLVNAIADAAVAAVGKDSVGGANHPFRWTEAGGMVDLGLPTGSTGALAYGVSADGSVVCGAGTSSTQAWIWTEADGFTILPAPSGATSPRAYGISADGTVVLGWCDISSAGRAFLWDAVGGSVALDLPTGGDSVVGNNLSTHISSDGTAVAGSCDNDVLWYWNATDGVVALPARPANYQGDAWVQGINADGTTILVMALHQTSGESAGFLYDVAGGTFTQLTTPAEYASLDTMGLSGDGGTTGANLYADPYVADVPGVFYTATDTGRALTLPGDNTDGWVYCISRDGLWVGGEVYNGTDEGATIWSVEEQTEFAVTLTEALVGTDTPAGQLVLLLREIASASATAAAILTAAVQLTESAQGREAIGIIWPVVLTEAMEGTATTTAVLVLRIAERLAATGVCSSVLEAVAVLSELLAAQDTLDAGLAATLTETGTVTDHLSANVTFWLHLIETLRATDTPTGAPLLTVVLADTGEGADTLTPDLTAAVLLREALHAQVTLTINGDTFTAWAVNTSTREATNYTGYDFNSFVEVNGQWHGCAADGLYALTGTQDAGEDIEWRLRTGLTNLGSGKQKRLPAAYIGYTSSGTVVLKVVTTTSQDADGVLDEHWYTLPERTAEMIRNNRFKLGRGLKSVHWGFELAGTGPVELDVVALYPMILDRRL